MMSKVIIFFMVSTLLLGCENSQDGAGVKMSKIDQSVIESVMESPQPVCVGRYMFDLPEHFFAEGASVYINKNAIEAQPMPFPAFEQRIRLREHELQSTEVYEKGNAPFLKSTYQPNDRKEGVIFERNINTMAPEGSRYLEAHYYNNGIAFSTGIKTKRFDAERYAKERLELPNYYVDNHTEKLIELRKLISRIQGFKPNESIPEGKGLCFNHGFIAGDSLSIVGSDWGEEDAGIAFKLKQFPKLTFKIETNNYLKEDKSLLERVGKGSLNNFISSFGDDIRVLAEDRRKVGGTDAEEWLVFNASDPDDVQYNFLMYMNEKSGSSSTPFLSAELRYELLGGELGDDDLTEEQLLSIWYQLTNSIRIRPGAI